MPIQIGQLLSIVLEVEVRMDQGQW